MPTYMDETKVRGSEKRSDEPRQRHRSEEIRFCFATASQLGEGGKLLQVLDCPISAYDTARSEDRMSPRGGGATNGGGGMEVSWDGVGGRELGPSRLSKKSMPKIKMGGIERR